MDNLKTYKIPQKAGITDLKGFLGDMATEWWTADDWAKWESEAPEREAWNKQYVEDLKAKGEYGKEYDLTISLVSHPLFDEPSHPISLSSSTLHIIDLGNDEKDSSK